MNFVFISPTFPANGERYCAALKGNGVNVLGIGDTPYENLSPTLKWALTQYYYVEDLHNYDQMLRAVAYLIYQHGRIDHLGSNNEYWLEQDARLRKDFNIGTGPDPSGLAIAKKKSAMKARCVREGIPTLPYIMADTAENVRAFAGEVGYPLVLKPDVGIGTRDGHVLATDAQVDAFFAQGLAKPMIAEKYEAQPIYAYYAIVNSRGEVLFDTQSITMSAVLEAARAKKTITYSVLPREDVEEGLRAAGAKALAAFGITQRMVCLEYLKDPARDGEYLLLKINSRPPDEYTMDMINHANHTDVYKIWADMVVYDEMTFPHSREKSISAYVGRRAGAKYKVPTEELCARYGDCVMAAQDVDASASGIMGDQMMILRLATLAQAEDFFAVASEEA